MPDSARSARRDRTRLYAAAFLRALAAGQTGVLLGVYLAKLKVGEAALGVIVGAGLTGAALAALLVTVAGDRLGRRATLMTLAVLSAAGAWAAALASAPVVLGAAAFAGMLNGMGRDRGAALVLEQAMLPATASDADRTRAFAWYNVIQDIGHALGGLLAALPVVLRGRGVAELLSFRASIALVGVCSLAALAVYAGLSPAVEAGRTARPAPVSPATRRTLWRISSLFALDSLGGGFLTTALLAFFFYQRFGVDVDALAPLFFAARLANAGSHLAAAWLARRIGLVNTMVFTHIPSSLLLLTVAWAPSFPIAAALFLLREGLVEMDVPTRQSYVMAVVQPGERVVASGVTHVVRLGAWAVAPSFAGLFMQGLSLMTPLIIGAGMKVTYDVLLYAAFRKLPPPEEQAALKAPP